METGYMKFCKKYKEKLEGDKESPSDYQVFSKHNAITFNLNVYEIGVMSFNGVYSGDNLFALDDEDIQYLYNKYSKKIKEEFDKNIEEVKGMYEGLI